MFAFNATGAQSKWQPARYVALVLGGGSGAGVRLVDLGDAEEMDQAVGDFRQCVRATQGAFRGLNLDPIRLDARREAQGQLDKAGRRLHDLAFRPIEKHLAGAGHVFISPEGSLSGVPFEAITDANGQFLVRRFTISYLNTGRELLRSAWPGKAAGAAIFADPDFDAARAASGPALAADEGGAPTSRARSADGRGADLRGLRFEPLPGTAEEATRVAALLGVPAERVYRGRSASKAALGALPAPRVLHIASHGFFLRRQEPQTQPATPASRPAGTTREPASQVPLDNPYLRSGLALAGANGWADANAPPGDNGLLTSLEVAGLSLHGTELVVLSACETGLGLQQRGEGVFGLRRAFFQAGAQGLIMSLWKVPDKETADLMERFYAAWLGGKGKADALRQAELETIDALRKSSNGTAHPFFWAGFVLVGDWR
jgi:CHAT domain-containing protein